MPNSLTTLDDHVAGILQARRATKEARFKPLADGVERVDDVMQQALASLHEALALLGFKAAPSQMILSRRLGRAHARHRPAPGLEQPVRAPASSRPCMCR